MTDTIEAVVDSRTMSRIDQQRLAQELVEQARAEGLELIGIHLDSYSSMNVSRCATPMPTRQSDGSPWKSLDQERTLAASASWASAFLQSSRGETSDKQREWPRDDRS